MDLTLILTIIGILVAVIIGVWQIYLAQKQIKSGTSKNSLPSPDSLVVLQEKETKDSEKQLSNANKTILWVDDDIEVIYAFVRHLEREGYKIQTATNLYKAKEIIQSSQKFDLVITDMILPYGDDNVDKDGHANYLGLDVIESVRASRGNIPILCFSVVRVDMFLKRFEKIGRIEYLQKGALLPTALCEWVKLILIANEAPTEEEAALEEMRRRQIELTSDGAYIRRRAIWALGELGHVDSAIINSLKEIGETDKGLSVREAAKEAVKKIQRRLKKSNSKRK